MFIFVSIPIPRLSDVFSAISVTDDPASMHTQEQLVEQISEVSTTGGIRHHGKVRYPSNERQEAATVASETLLRF